MLIKTNIQGYAKDSETGLIVNTTKSYHDFKLQKERIKKLNGNNEQLKTTKTELKELKNELSEMKELINKLLNGK